MRVINCRQYSHEYWKAHRGVPSASEFSSIITAKSAELSAGAGKYIFRLIADLSDERYGAHDDYVSASMFNGSRLEPEARAWYCLERNTDVTEVGFCMTDDGRFGCSPDALVGDDGGLELKCPAGKTHVGYLLGGGLPDEYKQQVHGCMAVTGRKWWDFASYCPGLPLFLIRVHWTDYTDALVAALDSFHAQYGVALRRMEAMGWEPTDMLPPEPVHSSPESEALAYKHEVEV